MYQAYKDGVPITQEYPFRRQVIFELYSMGLVGSANRSDFLPKDIEIKEREANSGCS
jgi:predicted regulator of amino acid metabolism with ACT domain